MQQKAVELTKGSMARPTFQSTLGSEFGRVESVLTATDREMWLSLSYARGAGHEVVTVLAKNCSEWEIKEVG